MLKPRHRLRHQLRILVQIPVGVGELGVPEIGGQRRQAALRVRAGAVAPTQDLDRHRMSQVVQARPAGGRDITQAKPPGQSPERAIQRRVTDAAAVCGYEEGFDGLAGQEGVTLFPIALQGDARRLMNGHKAGFAELAVADGDDALLQIDIVQIEF